MAHPLRQAICARQQRRRLRTCKIPTNCARTIPLHQIPLSIIKLKYQRMHVYYTIVAGMSSRETEAIATGKLCYEQIEGKTNVTYSYATHPLEFIHPRGPIRCNHDAVLTICHYNTLLHISTHSLLSTCQVMAKESSAVTAYALNATSKKSALVCVCNLNACDVECVLSVVACSCIVYTSDKKVFRSRCLADLHKSKQNVHASIGPHAILSFVLGPIACFFKAHDSSSYIQFDFCRLADQRSKVQLSINRSSSLES